MEVTKKINEVVGAVEKVKESAFRAGEVMGKFSNLKPLLSLYVGEKADPDQVRVSTIALLDALSMWLYQQEYSQSKESCDRFKATQGMSGSMPLVDLLLTEIDRSIADLDDLGRRSNIALLYGCRRVIKELHRITASMNLGHKNPPAQEESQK